MGTLEVEVPPAGGRRLLRADEEHLQLLAAVLKRGGRFAIIVVHGDLWPAALRSLAALLPDQTFVVTQINSHDEAAAAIRHPRRGEPRTTIVLELGPAADAPVETLNLQREDLRGAAANYLLVLKGREEARRFFDHAPDAYSYRDALINIEGEAEISPSDAEDVGRAEALEAQAREKDDPRERAALLIRAAHVHREEARYAPARALFDEAIALYERLPELTADDRAQLADSLYWSTDDVGGREEVRRLRRALEVIKPVAEEYPWQYAKILGEQRDALGTSLITAREAVQFARERRVSELEGCLYRLGDALQRRKNYREVGNVIAEIDRLPQETQSTWKAWIAWLKGGWLRETGQWRQAEALLQELLESDQHYDVAQRSVVMERYAALLAERGELEAAGRALEGAAQSIDVTVERARLAAESGRLDDALKQIESSSSLPEPDVQDEFMLAIWKAHLVADGVEAGLLSLDANVIEAPLLQRLYARIESQVGFDPPWDAIDCLLAMSDNALRYPGHEDEAYAYANRALSLAREGVSLLVPRAVRRLAVALLRLGRAAEVPKLLEEGVVAAREGENLGDLARLAGLRFWHHAVTGVDTSGALDGMMAAIDATGSQLLEAAILRQVGSATGRHDLVERARLIYRALPWPDREGACLEALGDKERALARYRSFGLVLREQILLHRNGRPPDLADLDS